MLRQYYYVNTEMTLEREAMFAANSCNLYTGKDNLQKSAKTLLDSIRRTTSSQVQIIDSDGIVLADSIEGLGVGYKVNSSDVESSLKGKPSNSIGNILFTNDTAISVSHPIKVDDKVIGVVRLISTLSKVNWIMVMDGLVLLLVDIAILLVVLLLSYFLSTTIIKPVKEITIAAEEIAQGKLDVRVPKRYDDEVGKLAITLNYMAKELSNHQKLTNDFIASISHELRTPLTSIKGWAATLNSGGFTDMGEIKEGLGIIENETDRLALLVNELLDFSKLTSKSASLGMEAIDVGEFICEIRNQMNPRAQRQGIDLGLEIEYDMALIKADRNRLKQVMINILDNSLKYTQEGGRIKISCQSKEDEVLIGIEDSGIGIPEDDLPKVKEKFYKVSTSFSGNGLGLAICDEIISLHNGRLEISSEFGVGTRVEIYLPLSKEIQL